MGSGSLSDSFRPSGSNYDLPQDVIDKTIAKYLEAYELLTGKKL